MTKKIDSAGLASKLMELVGLGAKTIANSLAVNIASDQTVNTAVTGTDVVKGKGITVTTRAGGALAASTTENVLTTTEAMLIQYMEVWKYGSMEVWTDDDANIGIQIKPYKTDKVTVGSMGALQSPTTALSGLISALRVRQGNSLFELTTDSAGSYKYVLKRAFELPAGMVLDVRNVSAGSLNIAMTLDYTTF